MVKTFRNYILLLGLAVYICAPVQANEDFQIATPFEWIEEVSLEDIPEPEDEYFPFGTQRLVDEYQTKYEPEQTIYFYRHAKKVVNYSGINDASSIEIIYFPLTQEITLHQVTVHRGSEKLDCTKRCNIEVLKRELDLENKILNGQKTIHLFLEDVRVGDIVEYSYSISHKNSPYADFISHKVPVEFTSQVGRYRERIIYPAKTRVTIDYQGTDLKPLKRKHKDTEELIWQIDNPSIVLTESETPSWYPSRASINIYDKKNWEDVVQFSIKRFKIPEQLSPELEEFIEEKKRKSDSAETLFLNVLHFIQNDIRYFSSAPDENGTPKDPSLVFRRRFGDCKDKSMLAITILNRLGINAHAALVSADKIKKSSSIVPSRKSFNHVIVVANIDGQKVWVDPTQSFQSGSIKNMVQPDYGHALILSKDTRGLTKIPSHNPAFPEQQIYETYDFKQNKDESCIFTVHSVYMGQEADNRRRYLTSEPKTILQEDSLSYYRQLYPSIEIQDNITITDDPASNSITVSEQYLIPGAWRKDEEERRKSFYYYAKDLNHVRSSIKGKRENPLSISHPIYSSKMMTFIFDEPSLNLKSELVTVKDEAFNYKRRQVVRENTVCIFYEFKTHQDHVLPERMDQFVQNLDKVKLDLSGQADLLISLSASNSTPEGLAYELTGESINQDEAYDSIDDSLNWPILLCFILITFALIYLAIKLYFHKSSRAKLIPSDARYQGLGGWLIAVALYIGYKFISNVSNLINLDFGLFFSRIWQMYASELSPFFNPTHMLSVSFYYLYVIFMIIFSVLLTALFIKKKHIFPFVLISTAWSSSIIFSIRMLLIHQIVFIDASLKYLILFILIHITTSTTLTSYALFSKRVRNTFINP